MNPAIELKPHQKNAVHRIITSPSSTLLHHVVGAGKTFTTIASIMKMRQLGLCKKAMVTVPNHLVQQWAGEWRKLYPNAHILVATKEDLEKDNRKKFVSKAALGERYHHRAEFIRQDPHLAGAADRKAARRDRKRGGNH